MYEVRISRKHRELPTSSLFASDTLPRCPYLVRLEPKCVRQCGSSVYPIPDKAGAGWRLALVGRRSQPKPRSDQEFPITIESRARGPHACPDASQRHRPKLIPRPRTKATGIPPRDHCEIAVAHASSPGSAGIATRAAAWRPLQLTMFIKQIIIQGFKRCD